MSTSVIAASIVALVVIVPWWLLVRRRPAAAIVGILVLAGFSSHVFALLYATGVPAGIVRGFIPIKDLLAITAVVGQMWCRPARDLKRLWPLAPPLSVLVIFTLLPARAPGSFAVSISLRSLLVGLLGLASGAMLTQAERREAVRWAATAMTFGAAYGLVELTFPTTWLTRVLRIGEYWRDVKGQASFLVFLPGRGLLPGNFFTNPYVLGSTRRLTGAFGDPLTAGVLLAFGLVWTVAAERGLRRSVQSLLIATALLLTLTRAGWVLGLAVLVPIAITGTSPWRGRIRIAVLSALGIFILAVVMIYPPTREYVSSIAQGHSSSTAGHLDAFAGLRGHPYSVLGKGIGSYGSVVGIGTENVFATVLVQLGVLGGGVFLGGTLGQVVRSRRSWGPRGSFWGALLAVLVTWMVSEQWLTFNVGWTTAMWLSVGFPYNGRELVTNYGAPSGQETVPGRKVSRDQGFIQRFSLSSRDQKSIRGLGRRRTPLCIVVLGALAVAVFAPSGLPGGSVRKEARPPMPSVPAFHQGMVTGEIVFGNPSFVRYPVAGEAGSVLEISIDLMRSFGHNEFALYLEDRTSTVDDLLGVPPSRYLPVARSSRNEPVLILSGSVAASIRAPLAFTEILIKPLGETPAIAPNLQLSVRVVQSSKATMPPSVLSVREHSSGATFPIYTTLAPVQGNWVAGERLTASVVVRSLGGARQLGLYARPAGGGGDKPLSFFHKNLQVKFLVPVATQSLLLKPVGGSVRGALDVSLTVSASMS